MTAKHQDKELHYKDMPKDIEHFKTIVNYEIFISKEDDSIYIYPTEYYVETLRLTKSTIIEILKKLESKTE